LKGPTPSLFHLCAQATNPSVSVFSVCFPVKSVASVQKFFGFRFLQSGSAVPRDQRLPTGFSFLLILIWAPALRWRSRFPESLHSLICFSRSIFPAWFSAPVRELVRWSAFSLSVCVLVQDLPFTLARPSCPVSRLWISLGPQKSFRFLLFLRSRRTRPNQCQRPIPSRSHLR
jgi:hypothetical protein